MLKQISRLASKRPDGVRKRNEGGRKGYVLGSTMRPWYMPAAKGDEGGPRRVKCHSKRFVSRGEAWKSREGFAANSDASFTVCKVFVSIQVLWEIGELQGDGRMRLMVGFLVLNCPTVVMMAKLCRME
jgi:hypothetical protein